MTTILILLCLGLLDFQRSPVTDSLGKQFKVNELVEESTTGCATSPSEGRPSNHQIFIDVVNHDDPHEGATAISTLSAANYQTSLETPVVPSMKPYDPPGVPEPNPETPPVATVPEPPTAAILGISAAVLLYLLFGRKRQKLYRRT